MSGEKCFTAGEHARRPLTDRCVECLLARANEPGPRLMAKCGPPAWFPLPAPLDPAPPVWPGEGAPPIAPSAYARDWDVFLEREPEEPPFPAPLITSGDEEPVPDKTAATRVALHAAERGWDWTLTFARGYVGHAKTGRPLAKPRASIAVRLERGDERACAVYREDSSGWKWDTLYINGRKSESITAFEEGL